MSDRGYWPPGTRVRVRTSDSTYAVGTVEKIANDLYHVRLDHETLYWAFPQDVQPEPAVPAVRPWAIGERGTNTHNGRTFRVTKVPDRAPNPDFGFAAQGEYEDTGARLFLAAHPGKTTPRIEPVNDRLRRWLHRGHIEGEITTNDVRDALHLPEVYQPVVRCDPKASPEDARLREAVVRAALGWATASRQSPAVELAARARLLEAAETLEVHRS